MLYFKPPAKVIKNALWALRYRQFNQSAGRKTGWDRAKQLSKGIKNVSFNDINIMWAWFRRHEKNKAIPHKLINTPWKDNGFLMWQAWGGDEAYIWASNIRNVYKGANK